MVNNKQTQEIKNLTNNVNMINKFTFFLPFIFFSCIFNIFPIFSSKSSVLNIYSLGINLKSSCRWLVSENITIKSYSYLSSISLTKFLTKTDLPEQRFEHMTINECWAIFKFSILWTFVLKFIYFLSFSIILLYLYKYI